MRDLLDKLTWWIRSAIGKLTGNPVQDPGGRLGLTPTSTTWQAPSASRPSVDRFRTSVGQTTHHERQVGQAETDGRQDKATRSE